jgi:hypothetical protein
MDEPPPFAHLTALPIAQFMGALVEESVFTDFMGDFTFIEAEVNS